MPPPRPHPLTRSARVDRVIGWLETSWVRGWSPRPTLDPDELWAIAFRKHAPEHERTGRSEADIADFRLRLKRLCLAVRDEARLNALGETMAHGQLQRAITQRLELGALWSHRPALAQTRVAPPILVIGQMRSGTTRVHRLLGADPAHATTRFCDSWLPVPRRPDLRPAWSRLMLGLGNWLNPWMDMIHPVKPHKPDEELGWLAAALDHGAYEAQWHVPSYVAFSEGRDHTPVYAEFARIMRTDAAWHGNAHRPRVMKVPQFADNLPALLAAFPDARVVRTLRDPAEVARSAASLYANQMTVQSDTVDMDWVNAEVNRKIARREQVIDKALAQFAGPMSTARFTDLNENWEAEIARIYRDLSLPLTEAAMEAMRGEQDRTRSGDHRVHARQYAAFVKA
ncbi:sulfotransferase [Erythrobacter arachoides]|uniref:Sulfotransferase n=1 Tax=Aurantiacibacter arachoides TaxID=1850444 RepID=A0A845A245_9SPHN|nr:sulfotransferase [Aurantiacibacter arachoides]MXO93650.1 sulfotransferase [Aurantiacibacter arachoides]GGD47754.1 sulfotransferase family protein [Aurantiacibacter arachoides]